jgi:DNA-directed RNA polymerase specialized sigma24 family protein
MVFVGFKSPRAYYQYNKEGVGTIMTDKDISPLQLRILDTYYADNAKKLHRVVDRILSKFGGITYKDTGDFYSLANEVFVDAIRRYDGEQSFDGFLYSCLSNKIMSEITRRNCEKRKADRMSISVNAVNDKGEDYSLLDCIPSDFDTFEEASKRQENGQYCSKVQQYISRLSNQQVNILNLLIDGYKPFEVRRILELSPKEYTDNMQIMRSYENVRVLF